MSSSSTNTVNDVDISLGLPNLRVWELDENSTKYDNFVAAPSNEQLQGMWIGWATLIGFVAVFVTVVFLSILVNNYDEADWENLRQCEHSMMLLDETETTPIKRAMDEVKDEEASGSADGNVQSTHD